MCHDPVWAGKQHTGLGCPCLLLPLTQGRVLAVPYQLWFSLPAYCWLANLESGEKERKEHGQSLGSSSAQNWTGSLSRKAFTRSEREKLCIKALPCRADLHNDGPRQASNIDRKKKKSQENVSHMLLQNAACLWLWLLPGTLTVAASIFCDTCCIRLGVPPSLCTLSLPLNISAVPAVPCGNSSVLFSILLTYTVHITSIDIMLHLWKF